MAIKCRADSILPYIPQSDHSNKEGYAVVTSGTGVEVAASLTAIPLGVIVEGAPTTRYDAVAIADGGLSGTVRVKLAATPGTIVIGSYLIIHSDGSFKLDPGTGTNRTRMARALESGAANELIEAVLFSPQALT